MLDEKNEDREKEEASYSLLASATMIDYDEMKGDYN